jgi:tetratricopeptide (TPR) repeat protein
MADATLTQTKRAGPARRRVLKATGVLLALAVAGLGAWLAWSYANSPTLEAVETLLRRRKYDQAERAALAYLTWQRSDDRARFALARARAARNDYLGCIAALERVPAASPRRTEALFRAGQASQALGHGRDAERLYRACIARDPRGQDDAMNARISLMALLAMEERVEAFKALAWETYGVRPEAQCLPILNMMTRIDFEQTRPDINIPKLESLIRGDPSDSGAEGGLAAALDHQRETQKARDHYARALKLAPNDLELRERYLDLLHRMGEMETFEMVLAARPANAAARPRTQKFLGILAEAAGDLQAAEAAYRRGRDLDPLDPELHHRLSLVLFRLGRRDEASQEAAIRSQQRLARADMRRAWDRFADAYDTNPDQAGPELLLGMARASEASGFRREAVAWYSQTLVKDPKYREAREALGRLAK